MKSNKSVCDIFIPGVAGCKKIEITFIKSDNGPTIARCEELEISGSLSGNKVVNEKGNTVFTIAKLPKNIK